MFIFEAPYYVGRGYMLTVSQNSDVPSIDYTLFSIKRVSKPSVESLFCCPKCIQYRMLSDVVCLTWCSVMDAFWRVPSVGGSGGVLQRARRTPAVVPHSVANESIHRLYGKREWPIQPMVKSWRRLARWQRSRQWGTLSWSWRTHTLRVNSIGIVMI